MKTAFLLLLLTALLFAKQQAFEFTKQQQKIIAQQYSLQALRRIEEFEQKIQLFKQYPKQKQLLFVNRYCNQFVSEYDAVSRLKDDYWKTPLEFLLDGKGDCEDYAILKLEMLERLGFEKQKLYLGVVQSRGSLTYHMVLCYFSSFNKPPLVLDNLSFRVLNLKDRYDLTPLWLLNGGKIYKLSQEYLLHETTKQKQLEKTYKNFLQRKKLKKKLF